MAKLRCVTRYRNEPLNAVYQPGDVLDVDEAMAAFLLRDAPGCFERVKALGRPPANKAVLDAPESKGAAEHDYTVISGISDARQRQLRLAGLYTYADLAEVDAGVLMQLRGVGEQTANEWKEQAEELSDGR